MSTHIESEQPEKPPQTSLPMLKQEARILLRWVVGMLLCVLVVRTVALDVRPVQGPSMEPALEDGDRVLIWKLPFVLGRLPLLGGIASASQGDILVFKDQAAEQKRYVKRLIAQGAPQDAPGGVQALSAKPEESSARVSVLMDRGTVFVDNHPLDEPYVTEELKPDPERHEIQLGPGELFLLGDHRSVSKDSRRLGPIPLARIEGRVILRVWPLSKLGTL